VEEIFEHPWVAGGVPAATEHEVFEDLSRRKLILVEPSSQSETQDDQSLMKEEQA
jgi:hypothetical protein